MTNKCKQLSHDDLYSNINSILNNSAHKSPILLLFATNSSGKTRLSKRFSEDKGEDSLCYNAYLEDSFFWDNTTTSLLIHKDDWVMTLIKELDLYGEITDLFLEFTNSKIEPIIEVGSSKLAKKYKDYATITFKKQTGDDSGSGNIKISKGEESIFIWTVFYTILNSCIVALNDDTSKRITQAFNSIKYIIIDDPVSSMDDSRIIKVALSLSKLISTAKTQLKFLITSHHALFYNVLANQWFDKKLFDKKKFILSKNNINLMLKEEKNDSPFAYHHMMINEIEKAIKDKIINKFHFNLFRVILEKTANYLGYPHWKRCLIDCKAQDEFIKKIDQYSHERLSEIEYSQLEENEQEIYTTVFTSFMQKYTFKEYPPLKSK